MADELTSIASRIGTVNPDLLSERRQTTFNVAEITNILDGGKEKTKRRKELETLLIEKHGLRIRDTIFLSDSEKYEAALVLSVQMFRLKRDQGWSEDDYHMANAIMRGHNPLSLHHSMFIPCLERLATDKQKSQWLTQARSYSIIGTYAQTELGHGTYLPELETTATFDHDTDEFVMNTPKLSSIKWWPGALGKSASHALVLAQLVINGKKLGMNAFMVQLRSLEDHSLMPGVTCGTIGPKMGGNMTDNGFMFLSNVRIPRENMLMKNQQVSKTGNFTTQGPSKANYATMVYVRVAICQWSAGILMAATTAAVRYAAVRRQSTLKPGTPEMKVLDYQTQQYKLFLPLASAYGFFLVHKVLGRRYETLMMEIQHGNAKNLPELHIWSSGAKALVTELLVMHLEACRRACGGHGYLKSAGISDMLCDATPLATVEGENTVLYLQVARSLMKQIAKALSGNKLSGTMEYLSMNESAFICPLQTAEDCRNLYFLCDIYRKRAYSIILQVAKTLQGDMESGCEQEVAMNNSLQPLVNAAKAHCYVLLVSSFVEGLESLSPSAPVKKVLTDLCTLFVTHYITTQSGEFLETEALGLQQLQWLKKQELQLLAKIRPNAVALVDAFDIHDETLCSAIGCYDGWAYERLYEYALKDPLNKSEVHPSYHRHLKHLMKEGAKSKL